MFIDYLTLPMFTGICIPASAYRTWFHPVLKKPELLLPAGLILLGPLLSHLRTCAQQQKCKLKGVKTWRLIRYINSSQLLGPDQDREHLKGHSIIHYHESIQDRDHRNMLSDRSLHLSPPADLAL
jgi:hypothetical protein